MAKKRDGKKIGKKALVRIEKDGKYYSKRGKQLTRACNTQTEAQFFSWIRSLLRKGSVRWKPRVMYLQSKRQAYIGDNKRAKWAYECCRCKRLFIQKDIEINHLQPCGSLRGFEDIAGFIERLFCEIDGFEILCKPCHLLYKTNEG